MRGLNRQVEHHLFPGALRAPPRSQDRQGAAAKFDCRTRPDRTAAAISRRARGSSRRWARRSRSGGASSAWRSTSTRSVKASCVQRPGAARGDDRGRKTPHSRRGPTRTRRGAGLGAGLSPNGGGEAVVSFCRRHSLCRQCTANCSRKAFPSARARASPAAVPVLNVTVANVGARK